MTRPFDEALSGVLQDPGQLLKIQQAVESGDRSAFTKALLGRDTPTFLDYVSGEGNFTRTWDMFDSLMSQQVQGALARKQARELAPTLEEAASGFGGTLPQSIVPTQAQMAPPSAQRPILSEGLAGLAPTPIELATLQKRSGEFSPLIDPAAKLNVQQIQTLDAMRAGRVVEPDAPFVPPSVASKQLEPPKRDIREVGGQLYEIPPAGAPIQLPGVPQPPKALTNPVDQRVAVLSKGKYLTLADALKAGDQSLAAQAEEDVRVSRPTQIAGATGLQAQQITQQAPLPQAERKNLFDRKAFLATGELKRLPAGTTKGTAARADVVEIDDKQLENLASLQGSIASVRGMFDMADEIITAQTPVQAAKQGIALTAAAALKTNAAAATYKSTKDAFTTTTARQVGQERGVLTDQDVARWSRTLPDFSDTVAVKEKKRRIFNRILNATVEANRRILAGDDPKVVVRETHKMLDPLLRQADELKLSASEIVKGAKPK